MTRGDSSILLIRPYRPEDFPGLVAAVTPARVAAHFAVLDLRVPWPRRAAAARTY